MSEKSHDDLVVEIYRDFAKRQNDHQVAYNKTIFGLGYGGALGIWALERNEITPWSAAFVGVLMIVSLTSYLVFEIVQMLVTQRNGTKLYAAMEAVEDNAAKVAAFNRTQEEIDSFHTRWIEPMWAFSITLSIVTASVAAVYLATILIMKLVR